jgi:hypothetical protein
MSLMSSQPDAVKQAMMREMAASQQPGGAPGGGMPQGA